MVDGFVCGRIPSMGTDVDVEKKNVEKVSRWYAACLEAQRGCCYAELDLLFTQQAMVQNTGSHIIHSPLNESHKALGRRMCMSTLDVEEGRVGLPTPGVLADKKRRLEREVMMCENQEKTCRTWILGFGGEIVKRKRRFTRLGRIACRIIQRDDSVSRRV